MSATAILTHYKGYRFRSRLEARWAVFFDAMGIVWEYEKEGFELSSGRYLPDFWLPKFKTWAEVKPVSLNKREDTLCRELVVATKSACLYLVGVPDFKDYTIIDASLAEARGEFGDVATVDVALISDWFSEDRFGYIMCYDDPDDYGSDYRDAVVAARSARFEFGEQGAPR